MSIIRSLLFNSCKYSQGLSSAPRRYYRTTLVHFKWPTQMRNSQKYKFLNAKPVKIWEGMTIWDLARSMKRDKSFLDQVIRPNFASHVEGTTQKIISMKAIRKFLVSQGELFRVINSAPVHTYKINESFSNQKKRKSFPTTKTENEVNRPPVVTIMGHVDHGKTTLLDALRNSNTVDKEFGGITQHIGAFSVKLDNGKSITFIDTPGHAAFSSMRNRGANATDIVVLIVAADDGVMEQTIESIKMANNAGVPLVVAINKIDKAIKSLAEIKNELLDVGIQAEDLGGDVQVIPISALKRVNLDLLVEAILLQADCLTLTGDPNAPVEGIVIESSIGPRGRTATILVKRGTLRVRTVLLAGKALIRVKAMFDENGRELTEVALSQPAQIIGWKDLPHAGDKVVEVESEREGRLLIKEEKKFEMNKKMMEDYATIQEKSVQHHAEFTERKAEILMHKREGNIERLKEIYSPSSKSSEKTVECLKFSIIVKGDVDGSVDAILNIIDTYNCHDLCKLDLVDFGVGVVTGNDIDLAETFNATIYCFNLPYPNNLKEDILEKNVKIRFHNIIYQFVDDLKMDINETLPLAEEEEILGTGQVLQNFFINEGKHKVPVAGSICNTGEFNRKYLFRIKRNDEVIYDGTVHSLKHFKNEVNTIKKDTQCGIRLNDFADEFKVGDNIICYKKITVKQHIKWDPGF